MLLIQGAYKSTLSIKDLLIKGILSGAFLGFATTLAFTAAIDTKLSIVGAFVIRKIFACFVRTL